LSVSFIQAYRGQNGFTARATRDESISAGSASSTILSQAGSHAGFPNSSFCTAIGVGGGSFTGTGLVGSGPGAGGWLGAGASLAGDGWLAAGC